MSVEPSWLLPTTSGYDPLKKTVPASYHLRLTTAASRPRSYCQWCTWRSALLKRWMLGTHQGAFSHEHLDYYLDEFVFRFNRRRSRSRGKLFYRLVQQAMAFKPALSSHDRLARMVRFITLAYVPP